MSPRERNTRNPHEFVGGAQPDRELGHLSYTGQDSNLSSSNYMTIRNLLNLSDLCFQICKLGHKN